MATRATGTCCHETAGRVCFANPLGNGRTASGCYAVSIGPKCRTVRARWRSRGSRRRRTSLQSDRQPSRRAHRRRTRHPRRSGPKKREHDVVCPRQGWNSTPCTGTVGWHLEVSCIVRTGERPQDAGRSVSGRTRNGIHPERIRAILELLMDIAVDTQHPVGSDNPLRQVIVNTHSPVVFQQVPDDSVVFVKANEAVDNSGNRFKRAQFLCLSSTWRAQDSAHAARGDLLPYLNPVLPEAQTEPAVKQRVVDRDDVRQLLLFPH